MKTKLLTAKPSKLHSKFFDSKIKLGALMWSKSFLDISIYLWLYSMQKLVANTSEIMWKVAEKNNSNL